MTPFPLIITQGGGITLTFHGIVDPMLVHNSQPGMFTGNNSQPISHPLHSFQRPAFAGMPNALRPSPPIAQVQPSPGYTDIDKLKMRINNNMERMINANMERMMRMMTEQFS